MDSRDYIIKAFRHLLSKKKGCTQTEIATFMGVTPAILSGFLGKSRNFSEKKCEKLAKFFDTTYIDMLFLGKTLEKGGIEGPPKPEVTKATVQAMIDASLISQPTDLERHIANKHQQLLSQFRDKAQAHSINQKLIEIEKVSPDYLAELNDILAVKLNHLQKPKKQDVK